MRFPWTIDAVADFTGERISFPNVIQSWFLRGNASDSGTNGSSSSSAAGAASYDSETQTFSLPKTLDISTDRQLRLPDQSQGQTMRSDAQGTAPGPSAASPSATLSTTAFANSALNGIQTQGPALQQSPTVGPLTTPAAPQQPQLGLQSGTSPNFGRPLGPGFGAAAAGALVDQATSGEGGVGGSTSASTGQTSGSPVLGSSSPMNVQPGPASGPGGSGLLPPSGSGAGSQALTQMPQTQQQAVGFGVGTAAQMQQTSSPIPQPQLATSGPGSAPGVLPGTGPSASSASGLMNPSSTLSGVNSAQLGVARGASATTGPGAATASNQLLAMAQLDPSAASPPPPLQPFLAVTVGAQSPAPGSGAPAAGPGSHVIETIGGFQCTIPYTDDQGVRHDGCVQFTSVEGALYCYSTAVGLWDICSPAGASASPDSAGGVGPVPVPAPAAPAAAGFNTQ